MAFNRNRVLLLICVASMFKSSAGECKKTLRNKVIREGDSLTLDSGDNQNCSWAIVPSNLIFDILRNMSDDNGGLDRTFSPAFSLDDGSNLVMKRAETEPGLCPHATSGIYLLNCPGTDCVTAAKVVVVQSGPTCSCAYDRDTHSTIFSATIVYADTTKNDMYPEFDFYLRGQKQKTETPLPVRVDAYRFSCTSQYIIPGRSLGVLDNFKVKLFFSSPSNFPIDHVDQEAPDFTAECNFDRPCS